ncbi:MAG TPA: LmeA family phospholipid-binding protein [Anaerolineae bacterium]|nr:LmeA family phospholipid-binding protein [Anaerolineae bacterium]MCB0177874.1 LmeA family phospholipid-binding protein [Anaerolineae bacterium]MCB0222193.1 LmeA family phospholipid-binding protein [Anaerolineae bacterium]HRV93802.1 LmeA family phospholipid-binding protein [Anaerolineae bacterium]
MSETQPKVTGYSWLGCLGGILAGLLGGAVLLIVLSIVNAVTTDLPPASPTPPDQADLQITVDEAFLNRYIEQPVDGAASIDILPGNQARVVADTGVEVFGAIVPIQVIGTFALQPKGQTIEIVLIDTQISGFDLPLDLSGIFSEDIALVNQELNAAIDEMAATVGAPVAITGLTTSDNAIRLEFREFPGGVN